MLLRHLEVAPDEQVRSLDATVMFADVSGFTRLSERLARSGREGAERLTEAINSCFTALLADAYENGASLIKFGGDALLLWFDGEDHAARACTAAVAMRQTLRDIVRNRTGADKIVLRISIGIHSGTYETFLVGGSHVEYLIAGPAASTAVTMEAVAHSGQILVSKATAELLPPRCLGSMLGPGVLLSRSPRSAPQQRRKLPRAPLEVVARCLSTEMRAHLLAAPAAPEHRTATAAFLQFGGFDRLITERGATVAAQRLDELVRYVQEAADLYEVCFLGSDVAVDGGKLLLSAGAPRAVGDDEERMLLTLRHVIEAGPAIAIRAGVNRGHVFAGEVGPFYRRTYAVMGDAVNLAARLSAKAPFGQIYAAYGVLEHSETEFATAAIEPFHVKGKLLPVEVCQLGPIRRSRSPGSVRRELPLIGRSREMKALIQALADAGGGSGKLVEIVGETGSGKSRLLAEARGLAEKMQFIHTTCEAYTRGMPYVAWRDPMRQLLGLTWEDPPEVVLARLRDRNANPRLRTFCPGCRCSALCSTPMLRPPGRWRSWRRARASAQLHRSCCGSWRRCLAVPTLVQIEHAHLMDEASAALLRALAARLRSSSWIVIATRRDVDEGFVASDSEALKLELGPLSRADLRALAETTPESHVVAPHLLELAVERAGGSPEFLLDLLAAAADGSESLPKSVDAAAMARIDALAPSDRTLVRRAAVLGVSFHPRRLADVLDPEHGHAR